jgi:hypothetical protein
VPFGSYACCQNNNYRDQGEYEEFSVFHAD